MIALLLRSASKTGEPALLEEDEMDYSLKLNKELPRDIRVLAWCTVPADFSARHAFALPRPLLSLSHMHTQQQQPSHNSILDASMT